MPLILNEDANWNNIRTETKEDYLDYYMARKPVHYRGQYS